jgi:hypothetical protein
MQIQKKSISPPPRANAGAVVAPAALGSVVADASAIEIDIKQVRLTVKRRTEIGAAKFNVTVQ